MCKVKLLDAVTANSKTAKRIFLLLQGGLLFIFAFNTPKSETFSISSTFPQKLPTVVIGLMTSANATSHFSWVQQFYFHMLFFLKTGEHKHIFSLLLSFSSTLICFFWTHGDTANLLPHSPCRPKPSASLARASRLGAASSRQLAASS